MQQILYLEDQEFCQPFAKVKSGDEVTITVEAVLANAGSVPNFEAVDGKPEAKQRPFMQFVIRSVSNSQGRLLAENDEEDLERQIAEVKGFGESFDHADMEKQIAAAKMGKGVDDEEIVHAKDLKPAPASLLDADEMENLEDEISVVKGFEPRRKRRK